MTAALVVALAMTGLAAQALLERRDLGRHPAPGELVELADGRRLHAQVAGLEHSGPTVVLEAGSTSFSPQWANVQPLIADFAPVVSYDRAGYGWSDDRPTGWDADTVADDLAELLDRLDVPPPYVLVGHSHGALHARYFAHRYPERTAGLVLVDPNHEDQWNRIPAYSNELDQMRLMPLAARLGILRLLAPFDDLARDLPPGAFDQLRAHLYTTRHAAAIVDEGSTFRDVIADQVRAADIDLHDLPMTVLRAVGADWGEPEIVESMQRQLLNESTASKWIDVPGADHFTIAMHPQHAGTVADAVRQVLADSLHRP